MCAKARRLHACGGASVRARLVRAVARYRRDSLTLPDAPLGWPIVPQAFRPEAPQLGVLPGRSGGRYWD